MGNYSIRKATANDIPFLAEIVIAAEKSNSDKLSLATLFNLPEAEVRNFIIKMFEEDIDGCEFSVGSFLVADYQDTPVGGFGGWIEGNEEPPSKILKSNLIGYTFTSGNVAVIKTKADIIKNILIEREPMSLQLEYLYVAPEHRGNRIAEMLIDEHQKRALESYPELNKIQVQVFANNAGAIKLYQKIGFELKKTFKSSHPEILNYLPFNEKYLMEKYL